jgi:hypothetical protein
MDQLQLTFPKEAPASYKIHLYKNNTEIAYLRADSQVDASHKRRALIGLLDRSPYRKVSWEEDPRATGWFGLSINNGPANPAIIYHLTIEKDLGVRDE